MRNDTDGLKLLRAECGESGPYLAISDDELFGAMDLDGPGLDDVRAAVEKRDYEAAYTAWGQYWAARERPAYSVDRETYAAGIKIHFPKLADVIIRKADELWRDDLQHATYRPRRAGRTFQWAEQSSDTAYVGFHYFWFIKELARAFLLTGDPKYPTMFREVVCSWWEALPDVAAGASFCRAGSSRPDLTGMDIIWNRGLGSSLRCVFLMDNYALMRGRPEFTTELHGKILRIFLGHARYMLDQQLQQYNPSNFQTSQMSWMVTAAVMLPEFREAAQWLEMGIKRLRERIEKNYNQDGAQVELCPQYHLAGMRDITRATLLLRRNGIADLSRDKAIWKKLERIFDWPIRTAHPTGHLALFNSGDYCTEWQAFLPLGMQLFGSRLHAWAACRFIKPGFIPVAKNVSEYILFMDGEWVRTLNDGPAGELPSFTNDLMVDSGLAVLRSGWDENAFSLAFDFNREPYGGHAYPGRLSFDLWAYGAALVVNPGSPMSYSHPRYMAWCYKTISHNTVMVGERDQQKPYFAKLLAWRDGRRVTFVSAQTECYRESHGIIHQRSIVWVKGEYYFIFDRLTGGKGGTPLAWLLHCPLKLMKMENGSITTPSGRQGLLVVPDSETLEDCVVGFHKGFAAVPVNYHENYKPTDAWRDDVPYVRLDRTSDGQLGGQTYGALLAPFAEEPARVTVATEAASGASRLEVHTVRITWPDRVDVLTADSHGAEPVFHMLRRDADGEDLWSE